jgi:transcriptional regulator with XRE-family HTH domain
LALGLTLNDLSERSGLSPHYLSTLENDRRDPRVSTLLSVAKALRVAPAELLGTVHAGNDAPALGALFERAPSEVREAIAVLLQLIVAPGRRTAPRRR